MAGVSSDHSLTICAAPVAYLFFIRNSLGGVINDWRKHELELEPISLSYGPFILTKLNVPYTYCWSPGLVPKPNDWPHNFGENRSFLLKLLKSSTNPHK